MMSTLPVMRGVERRLFPSSSLWASAGGGPWESLWAFFIVVFVASMAIGAWVRPVGPVAWGVAWIPLVLGAFFVALLAAAATPVRREPHEVEPRAGADRSAMTFFWVLVLGFLVVWGSAWLV